ncbi:MAG TPA: tRNA lysidine(34) synthetase TilS [Gaiellaceae bacterium]|nr:tRNA lysidine(34) synthetase TilS [Gaiellaceae bacterium]
MTLPERVEASIREHGLIEPGGAVTCLVSGGADSTCLWHVLGALGFEVAPVHVNHGLRGEESEDDARFCREVLGAEVIDARGEGSEAALRDTRYRVTAGRGLRATGHTASDQVETVIYRLVSRGDTGGIERKRADGVVRPLLDVWREDTEAYCRDQGLAFRLDSSNPATARGLIRAEILPLLRRLHPSADVNLLHAAAERRLPRRVEEALLSLLASREGSKRIDLGAGLQAVREYDRVWLEPGPVALVGAVRWGAWTIESELPGLHVRGWRAGDRLAGRRMKVQDVFVNAKVPRSEREAWPLVVRGAEVVAVPGIVEAPGVIARRDG